MVDSTDDSTDDSGETVTVSSRAPEGASVRQPRGIVRLNDTAVAGWIDWTVSSNTFYEADTFRVSYAASLLPEANNANWFSAQKELFVEILAGFPTDADNPDPSELASLIYGRVDEIEFDPVERFITLTGRDVTAAFIDSKITDQYVNQTSSQIIQTLVAKHAGLEAVVTATKTKAGTYYQKDQVQLQASRSEWDLMAYLARKEAFVVYVQGKQVFFQADPTDESDPFDIVWQPPNDVVGYPVANVSQLTFSRSLTVAKGITVTARSPNRKTGKPTVQSYPSNPKAIQAGKASPFGDVQTFYFNMSADHSPTEVESFAKAQYDAIVSHEMKMRARMPADTALSTKRPIRVQGTDTAYDQIYYARQVVREMSLDQGFEMTIDAQNVHSDIQPES
jgi:phage protein D